MLFRSLITFTSLTANAAAALPAPIRPQSRFATRSCTTAGSGTNFLASDA
jgi:hypothetical protein